MELIKDINYRTIKHMRHFGVGFRSKLLQLVFFDEEDC